MNFIKEKNITRANFASSVIIVLLLSMAFIGTVTIFEYRNLSRELKKIEIEYTLLQKERIKAAVDDTLDRFRVKSTFAEKKTRFRLKDRVEEAHVVASHIYQVNKGQKSQEQIMDMIIEALRPARFYNNRGYYFILDVNGIIRLDGAAKDYEGHDYHDVLSPEIIKTLDELKIIAMDQGEGFYKNGGESFKISYVKQFAPYNWILGTSDNLKDVEDEIADNIIRESGISEKDTKETEYIFILKLHDINGGKEFGTMLLNPNLPELVGKKIPDSYQGAKGKEFVKEMLPGLRADGEAFVQYWFRKPGSENPSPKITYWKLFPQWNWIIGKGIYLDDLENILSQKKAAALLKIKKKLTLIGVVCLGFVVGAICLAYLFSRSINTLFLNYKSRQALQQKELLRFDLIINQAHDGIVVSDLEGKITHANISWAKMHGYDPEKITGLNHSAFHNPEQMTNEVMPCIEKVIQKGFDRSEIGHRNSDGSVFPTTMSTTLLIDEKNEPEGFLSIASDISEIVRGKQKAEEASLAKSVFLANMSHEIRTPMNGIIGMTRLALETALNTDQKKLLKNVQVSADGLLGLLNDILDFSKIEAGQLVMENKDFSLPTMLDNLRSTLAFDAKKKGLALEILNDRPDLPAFVQGDELRLSQILVNLIGNGIKFTEKGSVTLGVSFATMPDNLIELHFTVSDTGIGISPAKQKDIFSRFSQADTSTARQFGGTGLGLAITKQLVGMMGGKIRVDSEEGRGTRFDVTIVLKQGDKKNIMGGHHNNESVLNALNILLVEDNEINRDLAQMVMTKANACVAVAENGLAALKILADKEVDLVLMDIQMPVMDGFTATKIIRAHEKGHAETQGIPLDLGKKLSRRLFGRHLPIVAMTANAMGGDKEKCLALGMDEYLGKPFIPEDIFSVITRLDLHPGNGNG